MATELFGRYIWLVDTIKRYKAITRDQINELWMRSPLSNGEPMSRRSFYNYRQAIEEIFKLSIECNPATFEYYINEPDYHNESVTDWLLNSASTSEALTGCREISDRVFLENVPSAREFLPIIVKSLKEFHPITFAYHPYSRISPTPDVVIEPYFLKIFKQRWYVTGRNVKEDTIKTYALDRMRDVKMLPDEYEIPDSFDPETYFRDSFGIMFTQGEAKSVAIKADVRQAKYMRALPLHHSQHETIHDSYSIFYYRLKLTPDFVEEILSHGPSITVLNPPELRAMILTSLKDTMANYEANPMLDINTGAVFK